jgi:hypothetical protein
MGVIGIILNREEINKMRYPVVVEMWSKAVGASAYGSIRRKFHAEFTEPERIKARKIHNTFYRWYLKTGTPQQLVVKLDAKETYNPQDDLPIDPIPIQNTSQYAYLWTISTFHLARRLINFFGTL